MTLLKYVKDTREKKKIFVAKIIVVYIKHK